MSNLMTLPEDLQQAGEQLNKPSKPKQPETMEELYKHLKHLGSYERAVQPGDNEPLKWQRVAYVLNKEVPFRLIGKSRDDAMFCYYDLDTGIYSNSIKTMHKMVKQIEETLTEKKRKEALEHIKLEAPVVRPENNADLIAVDNGVFNDKTKKLMPFSPKYALISKIKTKYNPNATGKVVTKGGQTLFVLNKWMTEIANDDNQVKELLWQVVAEGINPNKTRRKIVFLVGDGLNGKGTFEALLINIIGEDQLATLKPENYNEPFGLGQLIGKTINIGDELSDEHLKDVSKLMSVASGDYVVATKKYMDPESHSFKILNVFSCNKMPIVKNKTRAYIDRLLPIPFDADFRGKKQDKKIKTEYLDHPEVREYALYKALHMDFDDFIEPGRSIELKEEYRKENDSIQAFYDEYYKVKNYHQIDRVPTPGIGYTLEGFKSLNRYRDSTQSDFAKQLYKKLDEEYPQEYEYKTAYIRQKDYDQLPEELKRGVNPGERQRCIIKIS